MRSVTPMSRRVVITGLGVVACCGEGKDEFWTAVRDGRSGIGRLDSFDVSDLACKIGGQVRSFDPLNYVEAKKARKQGRFVHFAVASARQAFEDAGLDGAPLDREQCGVSFGSSGAGFGNLADDGYRTVLEEGLKGLDAGVINEVPAHAATSHIAIELGLKGPTLSSSTGCVTAVVTISQAFEAIRNGQARVMIAGASEACLSRFVFGLLCRQRVMSTRNDEPTLACRPFDKNRDGLVLGEGAAAVVLETAEHAMNRGARIYGEVIGYGITCEAFHMVISLPTGEELARALGQALSMARLSPTDVDYACAHGIGNKQYDVADTRGLQQALGAHAYRIPVSSIKPVTAQPFAACAAMQLVAVSMGFISDTVPPTINYETPDEDCDLDYVPNVARRARIDTAIVNAHSFGGTHGALVLRRFA